MTCVSDTVGDVNQKDSEDGKQNAIHGMSTYLYIYAYI